jgi:hypothetical protein
MGHFDWLFMKNSKTYNTHPNRIFYYQYNIVDVFVFSSLIYHTRARFWAKDMGQTLVHILMHILDACAFILNFVYHMFAFRLFSIVWVFILIHIN